MTTPTETLILSLLRDHPLGAYGSQLVHASAGKLKRGSVYALLGRLEQSGFVTSVEEKAQDDYALPRTRWRITIAGHRTLTNGPLQTPFGCRWERPAPGWIDLVRSTP